MIQRILIAPDKFKGTLSAHAAAAAIAAGWKKARPRDVLELLPMTDGGDGFGAVLGEWMGARRKYCQTVDATHRSCRAGWWWDKKSRIAIIDSAVVIGLAMLPIRGFHPFQLDSFGLGKVLRAAEKAKQSRVILGIGGSATNDGGFGMARALGWKFCDDVDVEIKEWTRLDELATVRQPPEPLEIELTVAVDVENPLLGPKGCSRIYGPQKGLRPRDFPLAEKCLGRLASVLRKQNRIDYAKIPGAGAAGGLGFGLMAFAGATVESGFEIFARHTQIERRIRQADLVITGEGQMDAQTYMGKGVGQLARLCGRLGVPCLGMAGIVLQPARARRHFIQVRALTEVAGAEDGRRDAARFLKQLAENVATSPPCNWKII